MTEQLLSASLFVHVQLTPVFGVYNSVEFWCLRDLVKGIYFFFLENLAVVSYFHMLLYRVYEASAVSLIINLLTALLNGAALDIHCF